MTTRRQPGIRVQEPSAEDYERRPLLPRSALSRSHFAHSMDGEAYYSCNPNHNAHLPVYTNIHRIRRDVISIVEDYLTFDQLRDLRINISVVRPLVDKLYDLDDVSIVYCLLVNRARFLHEQSHMSNRQNVNFTRATLCEVVATRILRRFSEDNIGPQGLLLLANILVASFEPFQNAPDEVREQTSTWDMHQTVPALEVAIVTESKYFLGSAACQKVVDAIYTGHVMYTPSTWMDIIPDRYKQKPISLYDPRQAPLLNHYRLIVPRTRNILEVMQFAVLLALYLMFMAERDPDRLSPLEAVFVVYAFGWVLDQFATIIQHGWKVYTENLWSFLDVTFASIYWIYIVLRIHGWRTGQPRYDQQALDVLAMGAPVLMPRLAFNLLSDNLVFLSLRSMMADFTVLTFLAAWCFCGFLLSMVWLGEGRHNYITISEWMLWIWFGLDGTGVHRSAEFHWFLGPTLMITFAFLGNTLFLTILVSMLSNTFSTIVANATAEIQFRKAVLTLEGVKSDAIFAYQPPFNIIAVFVLLPMKFFVSPRWFHKIHVATVRAINLPILLMIAAAERHLLWSEDESKPQSRGKGWFWEKWSLSSHGSIQNVFEIEPPNSLEGDITIDDELTHHLIRRQFVRHTSTSEGSSAKPSQQSNNQPSKQNREFRPPARRDSVTPYGMLPDPMAGVVHDWESESSSDDEDLKTRLEALEQTTARIEAILKRFCSDSETRDEDQTLEEEEVHASEMTGTISDLDKSSQIG